MTDKEIIKKTADVLDKVFRRVALKSPYYEILRELQADILKSINKKEYAKELREKGFTIRQIARKMGFSHPGSISHLLKQTHDRR